MKFYDAALPAPHPRRVRIFQAEKGLNIERKLIDLFAQEHKTTEFLAKNSLGQVPVLELSDGDTISESVAICRYLEALYPEPNLFGTTPRQIAEIDMWIRRLELQLMIPLSAVWLHTHPLTVPYMQSQSMTRFPEYGEECRVRYLNKLAWLDEVLASRSFIAGDSYSMADIVAVSLIDFGVFVGIPIPVELKKLSRWHHTTSQRPSASA